MQRELKTENFSANSNESLVKVSNKEASSSGDNHLELTPNECNDMTNFVSDIKKMKSLNYVGAIEKSPFKANIYKELVVFKREDRNKGHVTAKWGEMEELIRIISDARDVAIDILRHRGGPNAVPSGTYNSGGLAR